jgi:MoaA/NifB/PqqE/SkfB family radical SAM enzyme
MKIEAEERIRKEENFKKAVEIAKNAIKEGVNNEFISKITGLSVEQVEKLRTEK